MFRLLILIFVIAFCFASTNKVEAKPNCQILADKIYAPYYAKANELNNSSIAQQQFDWIDGPEATDFNAYKNKLAEMQKELDKIYVTRIKQCELA